MTDPLEPNDLSHMTDENFNALCPQGEHAPGPEPLSSIAKAVMIAATNGNTNVVNDPVYKQCVAAALCVVADQVVPYESAAPWNEKKCDYDGEHWEVRQWVRKKILAIAAELKSCNE